MNHLIAPVMQEVREALEANGHNYPENSNAFNAYAVGYLAAQLVILRMARDRQDA